MNGLYALKPWYSRRLRRLVDAAVVRSVSPDVFTAAGSAAAAAGGAALTAGWWFPAGLLLAARLAGANLDGAVARARGVSRPWGFVLNEVGDRVSDLLMFAGLGLFAACGGDPIGGFAVTADLGWVALAAVAATLPTAASLAAAGAGATRRNGGPVGKTERCALVVLACAVPATLPAACITVAAGSLATAGLRLKATRRELAAA